MDAAASSHHDACPGLAGGWARSAPTRELVSAYLARPQDGPFHCPLCNAQAILRKGAERVDHFAHDAPRRPAPGGESDLHRHCKQQVCAALAASHPEGRWDIERTIPARPERGIAKLRPDASGRIGPWRVAVEVQASSLDAATITARTAAYAARGIHVLWIVPLPDEPIDPLMRPRRFERCLQRLYGGRTYYWWPGLQARVLPVHHGAAAREIPLNEWHVAGGYRRQAGGFEAEYRALKRAQFATILHIDRDFAPAGTLWRDILAKWW
ncbi:MAG TPA: competence protein CoiA family protein [Ramlibacter sp.]|jgi:competence protein CoiA|nr:competence protein CoiA family protein [Ramlibacter sp.]